MNTKSIMTVLTFIVQAMGYLPSAFEEVEKIVQAFGEAKDDKDRAKAIVDGLAEISTSVSKLL